MWVVFFVCFFKFNFFVVCGGIRSDLLNFESKQKLCSGLDHNLFYRLKPVEVCFCVFMFSSLDGARSSRVFKLLFSEVHAL